MAVKFWVLPPNVPRSFVKAFINPADFEKIEKDLPVSATGLEKKNVRGFKGFFLNRAPSLGVTPNLTLKVWVTIFLLIIFPLRAMGSEVIEETKTQVIVREHPKTGKPYVSIVSNEGPVEDPFAGQRKKMTRPDYRMLDPKIKSGKIPYEGPSSDRKKVYLLAASLATVGTVGGALAIAAAPVATGAGATGGAGAYAAAGGAVAAGTASGAWKATRSDPKNEEFIHKSESKLKWSETSKAEPAKSQ